MIDYIQNNHSTIFPLKQIIDFVGHSSDKVIKILEKLITHKKIIGSINIRNLNLEITKYYDSFECAICNWIKTDQKKFICKLCKAEVCENCYQEMESVGMINCPECGASLEISN